ncbi:hypothetical protein SMQE08_24120 [Serratia marcescens]|uniref:hypothetical protein n=1 Tax=Serratia TaxID=613 RepID=UPI00030B4D4C|nr:hypothetical protein [Serratia surfactantfaciens]WMW59891.1 hypothetical protein RE680_15135 [Serratia marcescens]AOE99986.1 hypothetical protein ATE40_012255 [Serratia surfactantfaciens]BEM88005.1 hypothetical protein SME46J_24750 [Serratia marcescens]BEO38324.1 hypothetical protein SMQE08_24120 [Serratia marcescens]BEO62070.1 hypothetical protein SMQE30_24930 [Serratia marcescens]
MANKIMLIMVINLFVAVALAVFNVIYIQKKMDIRYPSDTTPFQVAEKAQARIVSMRQTSVFLNNNPVVAFTLEINARSRQFTLTDHREVVLYVAMSRYQENSIYSVLLGENEKDVAFEKDSFGYPILFHRAS